MSATLHSALSFKNVRVALPRLHQRYPVFFGIGTAVLVALGLRLCGVVLTPLVFYEQGAAVCWPTDGILLAIFLMARRRDWLWIAAGFVASQFWQHSFSTFGVFLDCICNLVEVLVPAYFLPPFRSMSGWLRQPNLIGRFILFALILGPLAAALLGGEYFKGTHHARTYWALVLQWESGDALGIALWTPLVLALCSSETYDIFRPQRLVQTLLLLGTMGAVSWIIFSQTGYPLAFIIFPLLVMVVSSLGFAGAVISVNMLTIIAASATIRGTGPFMFVQGPYAVHRILVLQLFLILAMLMSFTITLIGLERQAVQNKLQVALKQMQMLATIDALTGLGNRRSFDIALASEWNRATRDGSSLALLLLDADCFKNYNDLYGHLAGDECLRQLGEALVGTLKRAGDTTARYGGEEFVALLPQTSLQQALGLAETLRVRVEQLNLVHAANPHGVITMSIGCSALTPKLGADPDSLIEAADRALYTAKQNGRNRVEFALAQASVNAQPESQPELKADAALA